MNRKRILLILTFSILCLAGWLYFHDQSKYARGKDTVAFFGDGTIQIYNLTDQRKVLRNNEIGEEIEPDVFMYFVANNDVYVVGANGYTIVNYSTGKVKQNGVLENFTPAEINIFKNKKRFTVINGAGMTQ